MDNNQFSDPSDLASSHNHVSEEPTVTLSPMPSSISSHFKVDDHHKQQDSSLSVGVAPQAVVRVLSPRGVEYVFMTIALFVGASGLISALISLFNGQTSFSVLEFPVAILVVSVPIFSWLFLRLKKAEVKDPSLRLEPSKRRSTQFIQIFSYVVCFFTLIGLVVGVFAKLSGQLNGGPIGKIILDALVILVVVGGILAYYWRDEHRS